MKRALKAVAALLSLLVSASFAHAQLSSINTNHGVYMGGVLVSAGTVTFTPINTQGTAIAFAQGGGGLNGPMAFSCTITAGLISGTCQIPDSALTTPANILYAVLITNTTTQKSFGYVVAGITGSTWALDSYGPPAQTSNIQQVQSAYGSTVPNSCISPSIFTQSTTSNFYQCIAGVFVQVTAGVSVNPIPAGAIADYNFMQGTGSVLTDNTGSGNNGTLGSGAAAPTWTPTGLTFSGNQIVSLPPSVNTGQTFAMGLCMNPIPGNASSLTFNQYPVVISSTMPGAQGLSIMYQMQLANTTNAAAPGVYGPAILARGGHSTQSQVMFSGCHTYIVTLGTNGTSVDHLYIDGVEVGSYGLQGTAAGAQNSGNLIIGASSTSDFFFNSSFNGTMYRLVIYPTALSSTAVSTLSGQIKADISNRGVALRPVPVPQLTPQLYAIGDSITNGVAGGVVTPWENSLTLTNQPAYTINNYGIGGIVLEAIAGSEVNRVAPQCGAGLGPTVTVVFAGTNDFNYLGTTAAADAQFVFSQLGSEIQILKNAGCKVYVATILSRGGNGLSGSAPYTWDAAKDAYDALILTGARQLGADGIIDFAADPTLGADGANATAAFIADHIHPTQTSQNRMGVIASNSLNYYFGNKVGNPNVVTATTYQMLSSDGAITAAPTAAAAYTMPDCVGPSGETYTISNPQSTFALTIIGKSGQPINGLATAITIPSNSLVTLRDVPNPKNISGCHWVM